MRIGIARSNSSEPHSDPHDLAPSSQDKSDLEHPPSPLGSSPWSKMQMGSMDKEILMLVLPALCAVIMDPLASAVDTFWVGKLPGATSLAAMNPNTSIYNFIFMILTYALAPAVTTQVNNALGKEHYVQAGTAIRNALVFSIVFGALMALVLAAFNQPILTVMGCTEKTMAAGKEYFLTRVWCLPAVMVITVGQGAYRGLKKLRTTMVISMLVAGTNMVLDPLLMFNFKLGLGGAGMATAISQWLGAIMFTLLLAHREKPLRVLTGFRWPAIAEMVPFLLNSATLMIRNVSVMAVWMVASALSAHQGIVQGAAHQILTQVFWVLAFVPEAFTPVAHILIGRTRAAGQTQMMRAYADRIQRHAAATGVAMGGMLLLAAPKVASIFSSSPAVSAAVSPALVVVSLVLVLAGLLYSVEGVLIGMGEEVQLAKVSVFSSAVAMVAETQLVGYKGVVGVWLAMAIFYTVRYILLALHYSRLGTLKANVPLVEVAGIAALLD